MNTPVMDALVEFVLDLELASLPADVVAGAQRSVTDWSAPRSAALSSRSRSRSAR
jgi:hypothetical protein